jgi:hypothetical protein
MLWSFGIFFPILVCCVKKNLATLNLKMDNNCYDLCQTVQKVDQMKQFAVINLKTATQDIGLPLRAFNQGCQMVCFHTNMGIFPIASE